ncbi:MAG: hypothetical protein Q9174_006161 [Haloplaca sp. 1 TL-2023]
MAPFSTNYAEIQHDEIEALRSIYMEEFQEEAATVGAWNKSSDRAFKITLKPSSGDHDELRFVLRVSLPATYPKTVPKLAISFSEEVRAAVQAEAAEVLSSRPKALVGSEMIFEITTLLQDSLDHAARAKDQTVLTLEEERANQQAAAIRQAKVEQEQREVKKHQVLVEEEQYLAEMVSTQRAKEDKRREKVQTESGNANPGKFFECNPCSVPIRAVKYYQSLLKHAVHNVIEGLQ